MTQRQHDRGHARVPTDLVGWNRFGQDWFPRLLGLEVLALGDGRCRARFQASNLQAPHRYLHGGAIVALADAAAERGDLCLT